MCIINKNRIEYVHIYYFKHQNSYGKNKKPGPGGRAAPTSPPGGHSPNLHQQATGPTHREYGEAPFFKNSRGHEERHGMEETKRQNAKPTRWWWRRPSRRRRLERNWETTEAAGAHCRNAAHIFTLATTSAPWPTSVRLIAPPSSFLQAEASSGPAVFTQP